jgi:thiamine transport system permease protein
MKTIRSMMLAAVPATFVAVFFAYPVATLLARGIGLDADRLLDVITGSRFLKVIWFTIWQAALSTLLAGALAVPLTWAIANRQFSGRRLARVLVTVPFVLPTVVVAAAFIGFMDRFGLDQGTIRLRHTVWAILLAHAFFNIAVFVRSVGGFWTQLDRRPEEAARTLGASPWQAFREVTLPRLQPSIIAATSVVFLFSATSFAVILLLGGPRRSSIETEIYRYAVTRSDISTAAALSIVQMVAVVSLVVANGWLQRRAAGRQGLVADRAVPAQTRQQRTRLAAALAGTALVLGLPLAVLVERSVATGGGYSFANYQALGERVRLLPISATDALLNSMTFAVVAAGIALVIGGMASLAIVHGTRSVSRVLDLGMLLPLGTSAVTLGFGVLISLDRGVLDLRSSWWIVPITQSLIAIPFVVRGVVPVLRAIDPALREAAATLGAAPARVRREIDLRIGARALATGVGFAFAISLGEFGATSFVGRRSDLLTVPLAIQRLLSTPGDLLRGQAMALSVILMLVTTVVVFIGDRLHPKAGGLL